MEKIRGKAIETKDGFYIRDYLLQHEEIKKYGYDADKLLDKEVEITGNIKEEENKDTEEITQKREGTVRKICDISSIRIIG